MQKTIPDVFFNMLPLPIIVVKHEDGTLNHPLSFVNNAFTEHFGWELSEIPDKNAWWHKAYPEEQYRKVVERQWELVVETALEDEDGFVLMTVNIMTKHKGVQRFRVYTELDSILLEGYYVVALEPVAQTRESVIPQLQSSL